MVPEPGELDKVTEGPEYTVERILQHRVAAGEDELEFQIKWADYADPTWTKRTHVSEEMVSRFFKRLRKGKDPTKRRRSKRVSMEPTRVVLT